MAITIKFDTSHNVEIPTFVLGKRNGDKIGALENVDNINLKDCMVDTPEISFTVHKHNNGKECEYWDEIKDFRLVWCKEWDMWFQMTIDTNISDETTKNVLLVRLAEAELSQTNLYGIEINTELDISRDDYTEPTVLYNAENHKASLVHRILEKVPHYSIKHIDISIANIQRTFEFDGIALTDALQEIATEINALVVYHSNTDENGKIERQISFYDLESNCLDCEHRGEFTSTCPKCGSKNITEGYGEDTTICIDDENVLGNDITLEVDTDSVKNCFKLVTGDDLLTATVVNCNPNGTEYLWYFSDDMKDEMSTELVDRINSYDDLFARYKNEHQAEVSDDILTEYNTMINDYNKRLNLNLENISKPIVGYSNLMTAYYNTIDMLLYLQSGLMPSFEMEDTTAEEQVALLTRDNLSPIAVSNINTASSTTVDSAVLGVAKLIVHPQYKVSIESSSFDTSAKIWSGVFKVENKDTNDYETDVATSNTVTITITGDYETFVKQKLNKILSNYYDEFNTDISSLFDKDEEEFKKEITKYSLNGLISLHDACQSCVDIMIEQNISSDDTTDLYIGLYKPYYDKLILLETEIAQREIEIGIVSNLQVEIEEVRNAIQENLNFEDYLGQDLWFEFCSFRREDIYENSNYISDGLENADLFKKALEFLDVAEKEIYKSATLQHKITSSLKNLLVIKEFKPLVKYFSCGNWLRIKIDDVLYKLRLLEYNINYDDLSNIDVTFSDVLNTSDGISDTRSVLEKASSMATSYDSVKRQASQGLESFVTLDNWIQKGLDATTINIVNSAENQTQSWDSHGMLYRQYDDITETYLPEQLKIINSGLYITDNNWETSRVGIGRFNYIDPESGELKETYGIIADTICSHLMLTENVGIYTENGKIAINKDGITINKDGDTNVTITPDGKLTCNGAIINGTITARQGEIGGFIIEEKYLYNDYYLGSIGLACDINRYAFWAGETNGSNGLLSSSNASFCVTRNGELFATDAKLFGNLTLENGIFFRGYNSYSMAHITATYASANSNTVSFNLYTGTDSLNGQLFIHSNYLVNIFSNNVRIEALKPTNALTTETPNIIIASDIIKINSISSASTASLTLNSYTIDITGTSTRLYGTTTNIYGTTTLYLSTNSAMSVKANEVRLSCGNVAPSSNADRVIRFDYDSSNHALFRPTTNGQTYLGSGSYRWRIIYSDDADFNTATISGLTIDGSSLLSHQLTMGTDVDSAEGLRFYINNNGTGRFKTLLKNGIGVSTTSSRRFKKDINYLSNDYWHDNFMKLKPCSFVYKLDKESKANIGLILEDIYDYMPEFTSNNEEGVPSYIEYGMFIIPLIAEVQTLNIKDEERKNEINNLKTEIEELKQLVNALIEGKV